MNSKLISTALAWLLLTTLLSAATLPKTQAKAQEKAGKTTQFGLAMPAVRPDKPQAAFDAMFRDSKRSEDFFDLRNEVIDILKELTTMTSTANEKELRRNQAKIKQLVKKFQKAKSDLFKEAKKLRTPWDREYEKYVAEEKRLKALVDAATKKGDDRNATKFEQQIAKFASKMDNLKNSIDVINYYLYFDEEEILAKYLGTADGTRSSQKSRKQED